MPISDSNKKFLEDLLEYYINESESYTQFAEEYSEFIKSDTDMAFGLIVGSLYSTFLQTYSNQQLQIELDDIQEFHEFIKLNSEKIKKALELLKVNNYSGNSRIKSNQNFQRQKLTQEINNIIEKLEKQEDLKNSLNDYQELIKLNNIIEKKFQKKSKNIKQDMKEKIEDIINKKNVK